MMNKITVSLPAPVSSFDPVFVCGAPRTGTTLLLSLICTSASANPFSAECDYFNRAGPPIHRRAQPFRTCIPIATSPVLGDFERYHADLMRRVLTDLWRFLDEPAKLVLKDPGMTRYANIILKLLPEARMVVTLRDPKDVIASRVSIEMRRLGVVDPGAVSTEFVDSICREYNAVHEYILPLPDEDLRRIHFIRYEQLVQGQGLSDLAGFVGVGDFDTRLLWQRSVKMGERKVHSEWVSPLYGQGMTSSSVGRYRQVLNEAVAASVDAACAPTYQQLLQLGARNGAA
jgi:hypothetical protein